MRRIVVVLGVAAVMAAAVALTAGTALAQAQSETFVTRAPITLRIPNPCIPGEEVFFEGPIQVIAHETVDANGVVHVQGHTNFQGQGVSTSGDKSVRVEVVNAHNTFTADGSGDDFTFRYVQRFISQGSDTTEDDFQSNVLFHITRNANGEVTADVEVLDVECT